MIESNRFEFWFSDLGRSFLTYKFPIVDKIEHNFVLLILESLIHLCKTWTVCLKGVLTFPGPGCSAPGPRSSPALPSSPRRALPCLPFPLSLAGVGGCPLFLVRVTLGLLLLFFHPNFFVGLAQALVFASPTNSCTRFVPRKAISFLVAPTPDPQS